MYGQMETRAGRLSEDALLKLADDSGLELSLFRNCIQRARYTEAIQQEGRDASAKGVRGTPSFVLGHSIKNGVEGELVLGAMSFQELTAKLDSLASR